MSDLVPYQDLERMAQTVVNSRLFPVKTAQEAITLFLVAQAEGLHPMTAMRRYDVINGKPAMKTDAMLGGYFARGGKIRWHELTDSVADATFTTQGVPEGVRITWTLADAKRAGLDSKQTWRQYPRQMLRSRVVREGINATDPIVNQGMYTPEEIQDITEPQKPVPTEAEIVDSPAVESAKQLAAEAAKNRAEAIVEYAPAAFDKKNAEALPFPPPVCTRDGCISKIAEFESTSKQFMGRRYFQCVWAYEHKKQLMEEGAKNGVANNAVASHFREWAEPWPRTAAETGPVLSGSEPTPAARPKTVAEVTAEVEAMAHLTPQEKIELLSERINEALSGAAP